MTSTFAYDSNVLERFPTVRAGIIHAGGLRNGPSPAGLLDAFAAEQQAATNRLETTPVAQFPSIAAWRRAFSAFGVKPTQHRVAAEALLRRLTKQGDIPTINTLVDIGNLVSIRYAMPVAVLDQSAIAAPTVVRFASGAESFTDLGSTEVVSPAAGEVVFVDTNDVVSARRWCWRQSAGSATGPDTVEAIICIEGHHETAAEDIDSALADLESLLGAYQPESRYTVHRLSPNDPSM